MEAKLLFVSLVMGVHYFLNRHFEKKGLLNSRRRIALWHGFFWALAGFLLAYAAAVFLDNRKDFVSPALITGKQIFHGALCAIAGFAWGFLSAMRQSADQKTLDRYLKEDKDWSESVFSSVLFVSIFMYLVMQSFKIPSGSMRTTLMEGDHLFVNKFIYGLKIPFKSEKLLKLRPVKRGDVIVFRFPSEDPKELQCGGSQYGKDYIKRVIGLPGDTVEIREGRVYLNGALQDDGGYARYDDARLPTPKYLTTGPEYQKFWTARMLDKVAGGYVRDYMGPVTVPEGQYFAMGDNRDHSCDSRYWGPVPEENIKGKAWFIYWPVPRIKLVK